MIVYTKDDMVRLSGALVKNQWLTIKAAANLLLHQHPEGILIDCAELTHVSEDGAKTFLDAMKDIQGGGARILVCSLPESVLSVVRSVPGVRSQLPIAASVEAARASLRSASAAVDSGGAPGILIPVAPGLDAGLALGFVGPMVRERRMPVHLVCFVEVARHLPMGSPLPEEEAESELLMRAATEAAKRHSVAPRCHTERVRHVTDGVLAAQRSLHATHVVLGVGSSHSTDETTKSLVDLMLRKAPCDVVVVRQAAPDPGDAGGH